VGTDHENPIREMRRGRVRSRGRRFVPNHAQSILACDFLVSITAGFRVLYLLVIMEMEADGSCVRM
jgi:hypothetical protein